MHRSSRVSATGLSSRGLLLAVPALLALAVSAHAAVVMQEKTVSSGFGGFGNGTSERTIVIAGDRSRTDESSTYTGRFKTIAGGGKPRTSAEITRLDREVFWNLDPAKKQYSELTFAQLREQLAKGMAEAQSEMAKPDARKPDDVVTTFKVDVKRTGKKETINGFAAEQFIVTLTATSKDKSSGQEVGTYTMTMDQWLSTAVPGQAEAQAYYKQLAAKLGMDPQLQRAAGAAMAMYGDAMKEIAAKMKDMKGYPVRSTLTVQLGAVLTPEQQAELEKKKAAEQQAAAEEKKKKDAEKDAAAQGNAARSLASGDAGGAVSGFLGRRLAKAAEKKANASAQSNAGTPGSSASITVVTDLVSVTTGATTASFDVPSDFKKVERK